MIAFILYIPIWFYSNTSSCTGLYLLERLYIPIWFYSNFAMFIYPFLFIRFTFQSGSIQIIAAACAVCKFVIFTFQSGSIQIFLHLPLLYSIFTFTFQSGSIQMELHFYIKYPCQSLHSNLVLFKFFSRSAGREVLYLYIPIWFYSNDNGVIVFDKPYNLYIPIWFYSNWVKALISHPVHSSLHSNLVLFKFYTCIFLAFPVILYIPIWFYSNLSIISVLDGANLFTFQSGSIQM